MVFLAASDISSLSYQLLFTLAKLFFLFVFYIGFQVLVVSRACLFYSEGVFGVDLDYKPQDYFGLSRQWRCTDNRGPDKGGSTLIITVKSHAVSPVAINFRQQAKSIIMHG